MKIAYLSEARIPSRAASVVHVLKMCEALSAHGHDVTLFYAKNGALDRRELFKSYNVRYEYGLRGAKRARVRGLVYIYGVYIAALAWWSKADLALCRNLLGAVIAACLRIPVIYEAHISAKEQGFVSHFLLRNLIRRRELRGIVTITDSLKRHYEENYELSSKNILVLPDAASSFAEPSQQYNNGTVAGEIGILQVGYVGQLYEGRGVDVLLNIAKRCQWLHMHIIGGEPEDVRRWKEWCDGVKNITFYGHVDYSETDKYRKMCNVLVAPYQGMVRTAGNRSDTSAWMSPLKIFEYMASKKPIVCSRLPALQEVLTDGWNALLCEVDNVEDWIEKLERLHANSSLRQKLAKNAYNDYLTKYTWDGRAAKLLNEFAATEVEGVKASAQQSV